MNAADASALDAAWREHSRPVLATLIRLLGGFDLAEEALADAFLAAQKSWPKDGMPANPRAWLVSAGRFRAIDRIRRNARFDQLDDRAAEAIEAPPEDMLDDSAIRDDQLRLVFTCCHPALVPEAQVALTLRTVCGLTTEEIARAFLVATPTIAQRIVRAKARIREAGIRYEVPERDALPDRLDTVLGAIYLVFNEGYSARSGSELIRVDLAGEAIRLCRLVCDLLPDGEAYGLLALMLLQHSRRDARTDANGEIVLLADQDRSRWDRAMIAEGIALTDRAFATRQIGPYALQAAIAAEHASATGEADTNWRRIVSVYDVLMRAAPSPVVALNRAVAVGMAEAPAAGAAIIRGLIAEGSLKTYHLAYAALADMLRRDGRPAEAAIEYRRALDLCLLDPERRFLAARIAEMDAEAGT
jgi:RNA polymerase sigma-70 factor (ECF subfamily)